MSMKQCPICGEKYSDTYKTCPFCEDEKARQEGKANRRGRRCTQRSRQFSLITPTLVILILIMAGLLVYLLYGDQIAERFHGKEDDVPPVEDVLPPKDDQEDQEEPMKPEDSDDPEKPDEPDEEKPLMPEADGVEDKPGTKPDAKPDTKPETKPDTKPDTKPETKPDTKPNTKPETKPDTKPSTADGYKKAAALPAGITLSMTDFTVKVAGESHVIKASGGSGSYHWYSENPSVASVDANGKVTALSKGTVTIIATDGSKKGECIVRVNVANTEPVTPPSATQTSTSAKLSKEDYTTSVGQPDVKLKVTGTSSKVTWSSNDTGIATVSADGVVKAVGKGTTTIQAKVDGATLSCIVRVK